MRLALIGTPLSGVKTVYNAVTGNAESSSTVQGGRISVLKVPDERLDCLAQVFRPRRVVQAVIELAEFPGLFSGSKSDAQALAKVREADALALTIRAFESDVAPHPLGVVDPLRDLDSLETEMALADLAVVEARLEKLAASVKRRDNEDDLAEHAVLLCVKERLEEGGGVRGLDLSEQDRKRIKGFGFLTAKPRLAILNIGESHLGEEESLTAPLRRRHYVAEAFCASLEAELCGLDEEDRREFMNGFGLDRSAAPRVVAAAYRVLDVRTFFTYSADECRAWNVKAGETALDAAAAVHTDLARGFIRAEVISYQDFSEYGDVKGVKAAGKFRLEGKGYRVQDGDLIIIRHSS